MKFNTVKTIIALAIALLLGFVCEILAPETDSRNWISLVVGFVSIASTIVPATGIRYHNPQRGVSVKVFSWIMVVAITLANIIFSCFEYKIDAYVVIILLLAVISWGIIYGLYSAKER